MKYFVLFVILIFSVQADDKTSAEVKDFLKKLDGNYKERKVASKQLNNLPVKFYPYLKTYLESKEVSMEVKLRLTKEKMFPLRAKWLHDSRMKWYKKHLLDAYEKHGKKNPKWDKDVVKALNLVLKQFDEYWYIQNYAGAIGKACQVAVKKGCKDPLILYFMARGNRIKLIDKNNNQLKKLHMQAAAALVKSAYHPYFKFRAVRLAGYYVKLKNRANQKPSSKDLKNSQKKLKESIPFFKEMLTDKEFPFVEYCYNMDQFCSVYAETGTTQFKALELIKPYIIEAYGQDSTIMLMTEGWISANEISRAQNEDFESGKVMRKNAIDLLTQAWKMDPARTDVAVRLLKVAEFANDKEMFNKWYNNILLADPSNIDAYNRKITFIQSNGSTEDFWAFAEEIIKKGGPMLKNVPTLVDKLSIKLADANPKYFFDFDAIYQNGKVWSLLDRSFSKYAAEFPDDKSRIFEYASYAARLGYWAKAHMLFQKAGSLNSYKGNYDLTRLRERKLEASLYVNRKISAPKPHFVDVEARILESYKQKKATGDYDFWKFYQANNEANEKNDPVIKSALDDIAESWCGNPKLVRDQIKKAQIPHEQFGKLREGGNKDPFVYMLWADLKDAWYKDEKSHYFLAANQLLESKYPDNIKALAIAMGINNLGNQKSVSKEEKAKALVLAKKYPELLGDYYIWSKQYEHFFDGLQKLKLLTPELAQPVFEKLMKINRTAESYIAQGYFNNRMAWYTHSKSKKKNWKLINEYNRKAKDSMKKAWLEDPLNGFASEAIFRYSAPGQKDYVLNFKRALYTNITTHDILDKYMRENSNAHGRSIKWSYYPHLYSQFTLLHYEHAEFDAKRNTKEENVRGRHWINVKRSFQTYLAKYPNDTYYRSKFALFAIKCGKDEDAADHLKVLGKYAVPWVFGGNQKLVEYRKKYIKK